MNQSFKLLALAMLAMLAVSTMTAGMALADDAEKKRCKCDLYESENGCWNIPLEDMGVAFCDPRKCSTRGECCVDYLSGIYCPSMLDLALSEDVIFSGDDLALTATFNVPAGATGIFQVFLPTAFTFTADTFFVDGVAFSPVVTDGLIELRDIVPGLHTITFTAVPSLLEAELDTFIGARAFTVSDGFILNFGQALPLVSVQPLDSDETNDCKVDGSSECDVDDECACEDVCCCDGCYCEADCPCCSSEC